MERLTRRDSDGDAICTVKDCRNDNCSWNCSHDIAVWNKLAEYEDAEEQGLLIRLPLKTGDTIWDNDFGRPCSYYVTGFSLGRLSPDEFDDYDSYDQLMVHYCGLGSDGRFPVSELGKTVFLTKAEAEAALADMRKKVQDADN